MKPWIGVDLDGTLAYYDGWVSIDHIGEPIPLMVDRVKEWLAKGMVVKIFTARVGSCDVNEKVNCEALIEQWCLTNIGEILPITCTKDFGMIQLWDDRCVQVVPNLGITFEDYLRTSHIKLEPGNEL